MGEMIHVLVADDHLIIRQGLRLILETADDMELVGEASDGAEAVQHAAALQPDVVLMDLRMPGMDGLTAIERLKIEQPQVAVVILTTFNEDDLMLRGLRAGAKGYLLKDTDRETLFNTIRAAARGETLLKPEIMTRLIAVAGSPTGQPGQRREAQRSDTTLDLTDREREVLAAVSKGDRSKEIALRLGITERTVKAHLDSIYNKLGVDSRAAAVSVALQRGLLSDKNDSRQ
jgi:NarL family two-component system response regulator YdfI